MVLVISCLIIITVPITVALAQTPCASVLQLNQLVLEGIRLPQNSDVILLSHEGNATSCFRGFSKAFTFQLSYHSTPKWQATDWEAEFVQSIAPHTLFFINCENLNQIEAAITNFQNVYQETSESNTLLLPVFTILLSNNLAKEIQPEMREEWSIQFAPDSQVYFLVWEACGSNSSVIISAIEIYSISNTSIVHNIALEDRERTCGSSSLEFFPKLVKTRTERRLNFQKALIVGVNVDDPDYLESTTYKRTNDSEKVEFAGGFEVLEFWYLRDALNFTEKAAKWPFYLRQAPNGSLTGLAIPINNGLANVCIGYTEFLEYRVAAPNGITFLHPTFYNEIQVFFKQPSASSIRDIFLNTFSREIWLCVMATWLLIVLVLIIFVQVKQRTVQNSVHPLDFRIYDEVWIWAIGAICQKGSHASPHSISMKMIFLIGITTGLIMYVAYSASLVSVLSVEVIPVNAFADLLSNKFGIFSDNHIPTASAVVKSLENRAVIKKLDGTDGRNVDIGLTMPQLFKSKLAIVSFSDSFYQVVLAKNYQPDFICKKVSNVLFQRRPAVGSMFVKRGSPLREYFNCKIALMKERGIMFRLRDHYIIATSVRCLQHGGIIQQLASKDVFTAYMIMAVGFVSSLVILVLERLRMFQVKKRDKHSYQKDYWKSFTEDNPNKNSITKKTQKQKFELDRQFRKTPSSNITLRNQCLLQ